MTDKVRFGILGCGTISAIHAEAIDKIPEAELYGLCSKELEDANSLSKRFGGIVFESYETMLKCPDIDAVVICTPTGQHSEQVIRALYSGKNVVCEKPMGINTEEADKIIEAERITGLKVCVISQLRFTPSIQAVKRAIDNGALGKLVSGSLEMKYFRSDAYYDSADWRGTWTLDGGGCLMNQGIHGIDILRFLMGPVKTVHGYIRTQQRKIEVEDSAVAILSYENGALGTIEGSTVCCPGYNRRIVICGDKGSTVIEEDNVVSWDCNGYQLDVSVEKKGKSGTSSDPRAVRYENHLRQLTNFVNSLLHNEKIWAPAESGRPAIEIIEAIYESSKTGKEVTIG